ncbi:rhomboid family intramembrane serine protease [Flavobacterium ardleyense]|uniref:Rhomboid family intramembrane serine protease n=1 Tax=Flavobacterium ardleyense TaxID=2038737 RepID=A0ABW5Z8A6_9FLAO
MLFISQDFITTATGNLVHLKDASEISSAKKDRFYKIENFSVLSYYEASYTEFRTSGRYNQNLNFEVYFVYPIVNDTSSNINKAKKLWYGVKFKDQISNRLSSAQKEERYNMFYEDCLDEMKNFDFHKLNHFESKPNSKDRDGFLMAIASRINEPLDDSYIILEPKLNSYEERNQNKFLWIFGSFGIGLTLFVFFLIWPGFSEIQQKRFLSGKKPKKDDLLDALQFLVPKDDHFVTSIILDLNILIFVLMIFLGVHFVSPTGLELLKWGANRRFETLNGDYWRLFSSMFVHGGIMHLILNVYGLAIAAIFIEPLLGRKKFTILYLLSGLFGSLASIWWYSNTISVGASGAIFGLYGAILGLFLIGAYTKESKSVLIFLGIFAGINLLMGFFGRGIDNAAHIGGLLGGILIVIVICKIDNSKSKC